MTENFEKLEKVKKKFSYYEIKYSHYSDIAYDPQALWSLLGSIRMTNKTPEDEEQRDVYLRVLNSYDVDHLEKLLSGDEEVSRWAVIEKMSRQAAAEMCVEGKYNVGTFKNILGLPIADYKLCMKRIAELVSIATDVSTQTTNIGIAGL